MLSKLMHLFIIFTWLLVTSGVTVTSHYCGNNLEYTSLNTVHKSSCDCKCPLCHNVTHIIKVKDDFYASDFRIHSPKIINVIWSELYSNQCFSFENNPYLSHQNFSPLILPFNADLTPAYLQIFRC